MTCQVLLELRRADVVSWLGRHEGAQLALARELAEQRVEVPNRTIFDAVERGAPQRDRAVAAEILQSRVVATHELALQRHAASAARNAHRRQCLGVRMQILQWRRVVERQVAFSEREHELGFEPREGAPQGATTTE